MRYWPIIVASLWLGSAEANQPAVADEACTADQDLVACVAHLRDQMAQISTRLQALEEQTRRSAVPLVNPGAWMPHFQRMEFAGPDIRMLQTSQQIEGFERIASSYNEMLLHLYLEWTSEPSTPREPPAGYATSTIYISVKYRDRELAIPLQLTMFRANVRYSTNHHQWVPIPADGRINVRRTISGETTPLPAGVQLVVSIIGLRGRGL